jgi:hypothetical protein
MIFAGGRAGLAEFLEGVAERERGRLRRAACGERGVIGGACFVGERLELDDEFLAEPDGLGVVGPFGKARLEERDLLLDGAGQDSHGKIGIDAGGGRV